MKDIWLEPNLLLQKAYFLENILDLYSCETISMMWIFSQRLGEKTLKIWQIRVFDIEKLLQPLGPAMLEFDAVNIGCLE